MGRLLASACSARSVSSSGKVPSTRSRGGGRGDAQQAGPVRPQGVDHRVQRPIVHDQHAALPGRCRLGARQGLGNGGPVHPGAGAGRSGDCAASRVCRTTSCASAATCVRSSCRRTMKRAPCAAGTWAWPCRVCTVKGLPAGTCAISAPWRRCTRRRSASGRYRWRCARPAAAGCRRPTPGCAALPWRYGHRPAGRAKA